MTDLTRYPYLDADLPLEERVADLVSRFTLEEKINLMCQYQDEVPRLGVKAYKHGTEAAHGMAWLGEATTFPQPIGLACTWDTDLLRRVGAVIGDEARGFFRRDPAVNGLTLWAPTVDMERDPRWGRTEEAYGEDPYLTGKLAAALVQGIQGDHPFYLKAVASLKHFLGNNNEIDRGSCSVSIDPRNMREYYLKAFEIPFREGGAQSMMTAYNAVNGVPANLNPDVNRIVKDEWGMDGFVVSDAGDVLGTVNDHHHVETYKEAVAATIKSGVDSITDDHDISKQAIRDALADGSLTEEDLDRALRNTFRVRIRLGEFDPDRDPYAGIDESAILHPAHREVALEAVRKSIVLLKNADRTLPLDRARTRRVAVIGPLADIVYRDWYSGTLPYAVSPAQGVAAKMGDDGVVARGASDRVRLKSRSTGRYVAATGDDGKLAATADSAEQAAVLEVTDWGWRCHTLIDESRRKYVTTDDVSVTASADEIWGWFTKEVFHVDRTTDGAWTITTWNGRAVTVKDGELAVTGENDTDAPEIFDAETVTDGLRESVETARQSDAAIVVVGNHPLINGKETIDRPDLTLPASQSRLIREVLQANPNTIVVVVGSYPFAIPEVQAHVPAALYVSHAGQELGTALADVLFGDDEPSGRLNMTWYRSVDQLPDFMDYDIIKGGRTYQYFDGEPLYPFGHGLTYADFEYAGLRLSADGLDADGEIEVAVEVRNVGERAGEEVVQLYASYGKSRIKRPRRQLLGFRRVRVEPGAVVTVRFPVRGQDLAFWDVTRDRWCVETGTVALGVGRSSGDVRGWQELAVRGETVPPRDLSRDTFAANYDDYAGIVMDACDESGTCAASAGPDAWMRYDDADFGDGAATFAARVASETGGTIEIRAGGPESAVVGTCEVAPAGRKQAWTSVTCPVSGLHGVGSVCLRIRGAVAVRTFRLYR